MFRFLRDQRSYRAGYRAGIRAAKRQPGEGGESGNLASLCKNLMEKEAMFNEFVTESQTMLDLLLKGGFLYWGMFKFQSIFESMKRYEKSLSSIQE